MNAQPQIAYYRVSTQRQGQSGLGLDAQREAVIRYLGRKPDFEFIEIESGTLKRANMRFELAIAIKKVKEVSGRLVIAKLDRLARNVHFISGLQESKVNFVCADNPNVIPMVVQILAVVAEYEAVQISQRTKDALKAKKDRGFILGRKKGWSMDDCIDIKNGKYTLEEYKAERKRLRDEKPNIKGFSAKDAVVLIGKWWEEGIGAHEIALKLRDGGYTTSQNSVWDSRLVRQLINEYKIERGEKIVKLEFDSMCVGGIEDGIDLERMELEKFVKAWQPKLENANNRYWMEKGEDVCVIDGDGINYGELCEMEGGEM